MQNSVWWSLLLNSSDTKEKKAIDTCGHNKRPVDSHGSTMCLIMTSTIHLLPLHTSQLHLLLPQPQPHLLQSLPHHHHLMVMTPIKTPLCLMWGSLSLRHLASRQSALSGYFNMLPCADHADPVQWPVLSHPHPQEDYVYCHQQYSVFTSPNSLCPPPFPLPAPNLSLESTQTTTPAFQKWPYLALIPTVPWFDDLLLDGLSLKSPKSLEIVKLSTIPYCLNENTISTWSEVKDQLLYLIKVLSKYRVCFCDEESPTFPYKYKYKKWHKNSAEALKAAQQSHLAFCIPMGYVSFSMVAWDNTYCTIDPKGDNYRWWWEIDLGRWNVPHNIIDLICNSELNCFNANYPWASIIIFHDCDFTHFINNLMKWDVPLWIYWGPFNRPWWLPGTHYQFPWPLCDNIENGRKIVLQNLSCNLEPPRIWEGSGQQWNKWGLAILKRRACEIAEFVMKADERERVIFYSKAAAQATHPLPTFPGPRVWAWWCNKDGYDERVPTTCSKAIQIFHQFEESQLWYNP